MGVAKRTPARKAQAYDDPSCRSHPQRPASGSGLSQNRSQAKRVPQRTQPKLRHVLGPSHDPFHLRGEGLRRGCVAEALARRAVEPGTELCQASSARFATGVSGGSHRRTRLFAFSTAPFSCGDCGSQNRTSIPVSFVRLGQARNSNPRSNVTERQADAGSGPSSPASRPRTRRDRRSSLR